MWGQGLRSAFIVALVLAGVALLAAFMVEWQSVNDKKVNMASAA
jgi:hypothetical protein